MRGYNTNPCAGQWDRKQPGELETPMARPIKEVVRVIAVTAKDLVEQDERGFDTSYLENKLQTALEKWLKLRQSKDGPNRFLETV
jgi:DNA polymerase III psi subunit